MLIGNRSVFVLGLLLCSVFFDYCALAAANGDKPLNRRPAQSKNENNPTTAPGSSGTDLDTSHWNTLKNKYGWTIKYPQDWNPDDHATTSGQVSFYGPGNCATERCAGFQVDAEIFQGDVKISPEEYLGANKASSNLFNQKTIGLDGFPAVDACYYTSGLNGRQPVREIAVKHHGRIVLITYSEGGKNKDAIKSPDDWRYVTTFDKILATITFFEPPKNVWPKS